MPLPKPNLDDRTFQQFVDEAKRRIPHYCPEWTDHNVSDPGVTLIELFAWMVEAMTYQLNRIPEKTYITLLELLGVTLRPEQPAKAELVFRLSAPVINDPLIIPRGTTVANQAIGSEVEVPFQTEADLVLYPAPLRACLAALGNGIYNPVNLPYQGNSGYQIFGEGEPHPGASFYLFYNTTDPRDLSSKDLSNHVLTLAISCKRAEGIGVDPNDTPLMWEAYCKHDRWVRLHVERDQTLGLNKTGEIVLYLPHDLKKYQITDERGTLHEGYCIRCGYNPSPRAGTYRYKESPLIQDIVSTTTGGLAPASHAAIVENEVLGYSNGQPGQSFYVTRPPILLPEQLDEAEVVRVHEGSEECDWAVRPNFGASTHTDRHVVIDRHSGEVRFGPRIRESDGTVIQHGMVPLRGSRIMLPRYRTGGGKAGNVGAGKLTVLKQAVAYVDRVTNPKPAEGGLDGETIEQAKERALRKLQVHTRAVTAADFAFLAQEAVPAQVARAHCVCDEPDEWDAAPAIKVYILPVVLYPDRRLDPELELTPNDELLVAVQKYLDERRILTTQVQVRAPSFAVLDVSATVELKAGASRAAVRQTALERLNRFLNPYVGGPQQNGWPFQRVPYQWEIEHTLASVPGVARVRTLVRMLDKKPIDEHILLDDGELVVAGDFSNIEFLSNGG